MTTLQKRESNLLLGTQMRRNRTVPTLAAYSVHHLSAGVGSLTIRAYGFNAAFVGD